MVGLGPVLGADFIISPALSFSWKVGYIFAQYYHDDSSRDDDNSEPSVYEEHAFASLSILFSTWSGYRGGEPSREPPPPDYYPPSRKHAPHHPGRW